MSDLQGRRIPGEEGSGGRRRCWIWLVLGLVLLLLLALLSPFACQPLTGRSDAGDGSGTRGDVGRSAPGNADATDAGNEGTGDGGTGEGQEEGDGAGGDEQAGPRDLPREKSPRRA